MSAFDDAYHELFTPVYNAMIEHGCGFYTLNAGDLASALGRMRRENTRTEAENKKLRKALSAMMTCMNGACADCVACEETDTDGIFLCRFDLWLEELGIVTPEEVDV